MPELSPTVFGAIVIAIVGLMVVIPRIRERSKRPTTHEMYFGDMTHQPSRVKVARVVHTAGQTPLGAPRAPSPTRQAPGGAEQPTPLKVPQ